jgi:hippurate hydrolase
MIAQPAEERGMGATAMLRDGLFKRWPRPDYALALHCDSELPAGMIGYREGYGMANVDSVDILVRGYGGHGAYPHRTIDPVVVAASIVVQLQTIVSRQVPPHDAAVVTVGSIHGGTKHNIIPNEVRLQLTVRTYSDKTRKMVISSIKRICHGVASAAGVPKDLLPVVSMNDEFTPSTYNTPALVERTVKVMREILGTEKVLRMEPKTWGEDFGQYGRVEPRIPIFMFTLGAQPRKLFAASQEPGGPRLPALHSSRFAPEPEPTIKTGVRAMSASVLALFSETSTRTR